MQSLSRIRKHQTMSENLRKILEIQPKKIAFYGVFGEAYFPDALKEKARVYARRLGCQILGFYVDSVEYREDGVTPMLTKHGFNSCIEFVEKPEVIIVIQDHIIVDDTLLMIDLKDTKGSDLEGIQFSANWQLEDMPRMLTNADVPYGYTVDGEFSYVKNLKTARLLRFVFVSWIAGSSIPQIRKNLKDLGLSLRQRDILDILRNPYYSGFCTVRQRHGLHTPIVSPEDYKHVAWRLELCGHI